MADGKTHQQYHDKGWPIALIIMVIGGIIFVLIEKSYVRAMIYVVFSALNYTLAKVVEPDIDLITVSNSDGEALALKNLVKKNARGWRWALTPFLLPVAFGGFIFAAWCLFYAWICSFGRGHRSLLSHGHVVGTVGRMIWFNVITYVLLSQVCLYGKTQWGWTNVFYELYLDLWLVPYIVSQFCMFLLSDEIHLLLDTKWAMHRLYTPTSGISRPTKATKEFAAKMSWYLKNT